MFILTTFQDIIQLPPHEFYKKSRESVEDKINEKYANKVVQKVGLCVCMWDLLKASDGLIGFGTGNVNVNVEFRMIVFRPFKGEIIAALIRKNTPTGMYLSTEFFENIFVPGTMLFEDCYYNADERVWVWPNEGSDIFFDDGTVVHARIETEKWQDAMQKKHDPATLANGVKDESVKAPYSIEAAMDDMGLGGVEWW